MILAAATLPPPAKSIEALRAATKSIGAFKATTSTIPPIPNSVSGFSFSSSKSKHRNTRTLFKSCCTDDKNNADDLFEDFSLLSTDIPWDTGSIWSTFSAYFFILHIPLSFGGLSVVAQILHRPVLDPSTKAVSMLILQITESVGALALLRYTAKPQHRLSGFFFGKELSEQRSLIKAFAMGSGFLIVLVLLISIIADRLIGPKDVNNPILKEILLNSSASKTACFFLYCFITPLLEEIVYRGFLLTSLASKMKWWQAVIISACVFSIAHFSGENCLQLFLIGCVLGSVYCWTGNLASSFSIHSVYNATILLVTIIS